MLVKGPLLIKRAACPSVNRIKGGVSDRDTAVTQYLLIKFRWFNPSVLSFNSLVSSYWDIPLTVQGDMTTFWHYIPFLGTKTSEIVDIHSQGKYKHNNAILPSVWLWMFWWSQAPGHQQEGYWPSFTEYSVPSTGKVRVTLYHSI